MRSFTVFFLCCLCTQLLNAQKLKQDLDSNGDTLYYTKEVKIFNQPGGQRAVGEYLKTSIYKSNGNYRLCLSIQTGRTNVFQIDQGSSAVLRLAGGEQITLTSLSSRSARNSSLNYGSFIFAFYRLSAADIRLLKSANLESVRVQASMGPMEYAIKGKFGDTLKEQLNQFDNLVIW